MTQQKARQNRIVGFFDTDAVVVDCGVLHNTGHVLKILRQGLAILTANHVRVHHDRRPTLHIHEPGRPFEVELDLMLLQQVEDGDVMLAEAQVLKGGLQFFRFHKQIGDDHDHGALGNLLRRFV